MNRKIKIAEVITRMDWGGSPDIFRIICRRLDLQRYELRIIFGESSHLSSKSKAFLEEYKDMLIRIPQLKRDISLIEDLRALVKFYCLFKREKFDIVHTHTAKAGFLARLAAWLAGVSVVIHTPHGHNFYGYFNPLFSGMIISAERMLTGMTDKIMVLTELEKRDYLRFRVGVEQKLKLIYTGLEEEGASGGRDRLLKEKLGIKEGELVVGFVGRLEPVKGLFYLAQAAKTILEKRNNVRFILVGEGSLGQELKQDLAGWMEPANKVIFAGWQEDIPGFMSIMDILVLPSLNEAVGLVLIEAQSHGVAVVATKAGGIPEIVRDKETGILVEPGDSRSLAEAVIRLLDDPELRETYARHGRQFVKDRFSARTLAENVFRMYEEELERKTCRR